MLQISFMKCSTPHCQVKCDSVEKRRSYRLFNRTAYRFFSVKKYQICQRASERADFGQPVYHHHVYVLLPTLFDQHADKSWLCWRLSPCPGMQP